MEMLRDWLTWQRGWAFGGAIFVILVSSALWRVWFGHGPSPVEDAKFRSVYANHRKAGLSYFLGIVGLSYSTYLLTSLSLGKLQEGEAKFHILVWTIGPPLWFFFEWFFWFDNHKCSTAVAQLRVAQDLASKLWAAVLAVMVAYRLGDIVKETLGNICGK